MGKCLTGHTVVSGSAFRVSDPAICLDRKAFMGYSIVIQRLGTDHELTEEATHDGSRESDGSASTASDPRSPVHAERSGDRTVNSAGRKAPARDGLSGQRVARLGVGHVWRARVRGGCSARETGTQRVRDKDRGPCRACEARHRRGGQAGVAKLPPPLLVITVRVVCDLKRPIPQAAAYFVRGSLCYPLVHSSRAAHAVSGTCRTERESWPLLDHE